MYLYLRNLRSLLVLLVNWNSTILTTGLFHSINTVFDNLLLLVSDADKIHTCGVVQESDPLGQY